jgi:hypothetical protein
MLDFEGIQPSSADSNPIPNASLQPSNVNIYAWTLFMPNRQQLAPGRTK